MMAEKDALSHNTEYWHQRALDLEAELRTAEFALLGLRLRLGAVEIAAEDARATAEWVQSWGHHGVPLAQIALIERAIRAERAE